MQKQTTSESLENNICTIPGTAELKGVEEGRSESCNMTEQAIRMLRRIRETKRKYTRETIRALLPFLDPTHCSPPSPMQTGCKSKFVSGQWRSNLYSTLQISPHFEVTTQTCLSLIAGSSSRFKSSSVHTRYSNFQHLCLLQREPIALCARPPLQPSSSC